MESLNLLSMQNLYKLINRKGEKIMVEDNEIKAEVSPFAIRLRRNQNI